MSKAKRGQIFNSVKTSVPQKNVFDLSHDVKMSGDMGELMPVCLVECVPGDKMNIGADTLVRLAPLNAPIMHRIDVSIHYFFVPNRIVWENWEEFIVDNGTTLAMPTFLIDGAITSDESKLLDYMGVPPYSGAGNGAGLVPTEISAIPFAGYQKIYNDYYRDENLVPEVTTQLLDGVNVASDYLEVRKRAWEHDYFTSCLPFAQKGTQVDIPLGEMTLDANWNSVGGSNPQWVDDAGNSIAGALDSAATIPPTVQAGGSGPVAYDPDGSLSTSATTINDLRRAFRLQEWLEKNARGGTRYIENILMHFGVRSSDKRLQRPEYITGVKSPVIISEVLNTTGATGELPQGNMAGHGVSVGQSKSGGYFCEEHGYIIGIMSITPKTAYQQGIPRTFLKNDPLDFYWPSFAHIGEQEIQNQELYAYDLLGTETFGYLPRYTEYKYIHSRVAGEMRNTLALWHCGRIFSTAPTLSEEFISMNTDTIDNRIFAVPSEDNMYIHVYNKIKAVRPMPVYGTPYL